MDRVALRVIGFCVVFGLMTSFAFAKLQKGDALPAFTLPSLSGGEISLARYIGKTNIIIYFWTPSYPPNIEDIHLLQKYQESRKDVKIVAVINIADDKKEVQRLIKDDKNTLSHVLDATGEITQLYDTQGTYPAVYFADKKGIVIETQLGGSLTPATLDKVFHGTQAGLSADLKNLGSIVQIAEGRVYFKKSTTLPLAEQDVLMAYQEVIIKDSDGNILESTVKPIALLQVQKIGKDGAGVAVLVNSFGDLAKNMKLTFPAARWNLEGAKLNNDSDDEAAMYQIAALVEPKVVYSYLNLGVLYLNRKDYPKAQDNFQKAIDMDPTNARAYFNRGVVDYEQKNYLAALDSFLSAVKNDSKFVDAYYNIGSLYYNKTPNLEKSIEYFLKTITLNPNHPRAYTNLGLCYEQKGDYKKAIVSYRKAIEIAPNDPWTGMVAKDHLDKLQRLYSAEELTTPK